MAQKKQQPHAANGGTAPVVAVAGWIVPGLGHLLMRKWTRAAVYFLAVAILAVAGLAMRGNVFPPSGGDAFDFLGFLADLGTGAFYLISKLIETSGADVSRAMGDYGTRLIATAGVLNLLIVLDAYEIAQGWKN